MLALTILSGLAALILGGDLLLRGATPLSLRLGVSPLLVGLVVVGFGTSTPELFTSLQAAFSGAPDIALGNVFGSNIANILLILGLSALLSPLAISRRALRRDGPALLAATLACVALAFSGSFGLLAGALLLCGLVAYLALAWRGERQEATATAPPEATTLALPAALVLAVLGIAITILGARLLVSGAVDLARIAGISEAVIGLTVVAVGTSLPELVTSVMAARRGQSALAFGNVIGSNLYNLLGILGATALASPRPLASAALLEDAVIMLAATLMLLWVAVTGWRVSRREGALLLALYAAYMLWLLRG